MRAVLASERRLLLDQVHVSFMNASAVVQLGLRCLLATLCFAAGFAVMWLRS
jgi:hypothetical protein